jgi:hypothetical protein
MQVLYFRPPGYDEGAFRLAVELNAEEQAVVASAPSVSFEIPRLERRSIYSDRDYEVAAVVNDNVELRGVLTRAGWFGHCYTNGVEEAHNPTPIGNVVTRLEERVNGALAIMRRWVDAARRR